MRTFHCACGNRVYFQNSICEHCGRLLGFLPDHLVVSAAEAAENENFRALAPIAAGSAYRQCANYRFEQVCNWLIEPGDESDYCRACRLNHLIPDLSVADNRTKWARIEDAKRRMLYTIYRLRLPVVARDKDPQTGLSFDFLADPAAGQKVYTGHDNGLITINVAEADPSRREEMRENMGERYRTLLGHFRHEIGHYYWDKLVDRTPWLPRFRKLFGDETQDYAESLQQHYDSGPPTDWPSRFVSAYASMHPWEDWAESWAHYLHIVDTLETANDYELSLHGEPLRLPPLLADGNAPAKQSPGDFDRQMKDWSNMALAMNGVNRSMGMPDPYPFVLSPTSIEKLHFVHSVVAEARTGTRG